MGQLAEQVTVAAGKAHTDRERAQQDLQAARKALAAAYAMPTKKDCDGCHGRKAAAIAAAEAAIAGAEERIRDATRRIGICEDTAEIFDPLGRRLQTALQALRQVPHDLGEVYELIYAFIRRGGKMPHLGRWIEVAPAKRAASRQGPGRAPASHDFRGRPSPAGRQPPSTTRRVPLWRNTTRRRPRDETRHLELNPRTPADPGADAAGRGAAGRSLRGLSGCGVLFGPLPRPGTGSAREGRADRRGWPPATPRLRRPALSGQRRLSRGHPDYAGEVDHAALLRRLAGYDGWALSTSAETLPGVLAACPPGVRVAAWHRGERPTASRWPLQPGNPSSTPAAGRSSVTGCSHDAPIRSCAASPRSPPCPAG